MDPMRTRVIVRCVAVLTVICLTGGWIAQAQERPVITKAQVDQWMQDLSNWGRWGADDQLGAVNLITQAKRREALALATTGEVVSLSLPIIVVPAPDDPNATADFTNLRVSTIPSGFLMERQQVAFHGATVSHLDALCHAHHEGKVYNGIPLEEVFDETGCTQMGISGLAGGIVTRGVLIDIPRLKGLDALETGTHVYPEDIEAWEEHAGVRIESGDALLLRTGRWARRAEHGPAREMSGWDATVMPFMAERDIALLGADSVHEAPDSVPGLGFNPIHRFAIVSRGMNLLDNLDLEAAAETAARLNRWEFMLVVAPLRIPGGTGSPVNPLAIF